MARKRSQVFEGTRMVTVGPFRLDQVEPKEVFVLVETVESLNKKLKKLPVIRLVSFKDLPPTEPLTTQQVAYIARCHFMTVLRHISKGNLPSRKIAGEYWCAKRDVEIWLASYDLKPTWSAVRCSNKKQNEVSYGKHDEDRVS